MTATVRRAGAPAGATLAASLTMVLATVAAAALAAALWSPEPCYAGYGDTGEIVLSDRWDMPITLGAIPAGKPTLVLVCDPAEVRCREAAVYFDAQAERIAASKVRPVCIMVSSREEARAAVAKMELGVAAYVDPAGAIASRLLGQQVLPALLLLDGKGKVVKVATGGGEALEGNIALMLEGRSTGRRWVIATLAAAVLVGAIVLAAN